MSLHGTSYSHLWILSLTTLRPRAQRVVLLHLEIWAAVFTTILDVGVVHNRME